MILKFHSCHLTIETFVGICNMDKRIADYRGDEKHDRYAQYTVEKAQGELQRIKSTSEGESHTPEGI
jgi:hypothetical protein